MTVTGAETARPVVDKPGVPIYAFSKCRSPEDVWFNDRFQELRRRIIENDPPEMCRKCPNLPGALDADKVFDPRKF